MRELNIQSLNKLKRGFIVKQENFKKQSKYSKVKVRTTTKKIDSTHQIRRTNINIVYFGVLSSTQNHILRKHEKPFYSDITFIISMDSTLTNP